MSTQPVFGVLSPYLGGWYYGNLLSGVVSAARAAGADVVAIQTLDAGTDHIEVGEPPDLGTPVGLDHIRGYLVVINAVSPRYLDAIRAAGRPVVTIAHEYPGVDCPVVLPDNRSGVLEAVTHLVGHGHRRIAFSGYLGAADIHQRYRTYREALLAHGLTPDPDLLFATDENQVSAGQRAGERMIAAGLPSTAVMAGTDATALGISRALLAAGLRLPADQAIIGFDDMADAAYAHPRLSTVHQPVEEIGRRAVAVLLDQIAGADPGRAYHRVPTRLVIRDSCGCADGTVVPVEPTEPIEPTGSRSYYGVRVTAIMDAVRRADPGLLPDALALVAAAARLPEPPRPEPLVELAQRATDLIRGVATGAGDHRAGLDVAAHAQALTMDLMQDQGRLQYAEGTYLQSCLSRQHGVSMHLLRSHEEDPAGLDWLGRTSATAAYLGLWSSEQALDQRDRVDLAGRFGRTPDQSHVVRTVPVTAFPPPDLIAAARTRPEGAVFVVPVKANASDWGLLAITDSVEKRVGTGREPVSQWGALLAVALDHRAVLRALRTQEDRLRTAALYDHLTGLPNRTLFVDRLRQVVEQARGRPGHRYGVLFLDLDGFKIVNDSLGHSAGDRLLVQVAERIRAGLRDCDVAARFGGDEFLVLLDHTDGPEMLERVADRLHEALSAPFQLDGQDVVIGASVGMADSGVGYTDAEDLLRDADLAMYSAKSTRRGSQALFDVGMHQQAVSRLRVETELRQALRNHEFEVHYQPIVELDSGLVRGFEALVRWRHPARGLVPPDRFLPVAEETGLIVPMGRWILDSACRQLAAWQRRTGRHDLTMSVNVADREMWHSSLVDAVRGSLRRHGLPPGSLAVEITEGVIMRNVVEARAILQDLHALGCRVYIDDFGTGYSSLEALHQLPIDALKIDKSFVSRLGEDPRSGELVRTIVLMGGNLDLDLIAEGIETPFQRDHLRALGCRYGQGYLHARPMRADAAETLLRTRAEAA